MKFKNCTHLLFFAISLLPLNNLFAQNVALGKTVVASSSDPSLPYPSSVNDGLGTGAQIDGSGNCVSGTCTRWSSNYTPTGSDNEWIYIDLATKYNLTGVKIYWEAANAKDFTIDVSDNAVSWTTVYTKTNNSDLVSTINITGNTARYVRMNGTARNNTTYGYSIWEFEITGTIVNALGPNIALNKTATASTEQNPGVTAAKAVDGEGGTGDANYAGGCNTGISTCTFWASDISDPQYIYVDLGATRALYQIILYWNEFMNAKDFTIDVSPDASAWTNVHTITNNSAYVNTYDLTGTSTRYVRVRGTARNATSFGYGLYEMEIYENIALPITLFDFNARINDNKEAELKWAATLDYGGEFVVERSANGKDFSAVGTISEASGSGGMKKQYTFTDRGPLPGKNYYRLKYTETGSASQYSRVTSVNFSATGHFVVYPNPVQKGKPVYVDLNKAVTGKVEIRVINALGTTVYTKRLQSNGNSVFEIPASPKIGAGNYMVQVITNNGEKHSRIIYIR